MLHTETVEAGTIYLIKQLLDDHLLRDFYLVGGTALALKMGHRKSIDIDLFTHTSFNSSLVAEHLRDKFKADQLRAISNGVFCYIQNIKIDLIAHQYALQKQLEVIKGVRMVSHEDLAAMKLHAIHQNGTRFKDFVDLFYLLEKLPLSQILHFYVQKYPGSSASQAVAALLYHEDIRYDNVLQMTGEALEKGLMRNRLIDAVHNPDKIFDSSFSLKSRQTTNDGIQKRDRRRTKNRGRKL